MKIIHSLLAALAALSTGIAMASVHTCPNPKDVLKIVKSSDYERGKSSLIHQGLVFKVDHEVKPVNDNEVAFKHLFFFDSSEVFCFYSGSNRGSVVARPIAEKITPVICSGSPESCKFETICSESLESCKFEVHQ